MGKLSELKRFLIERLGIGGARVPPPDNSASFKAFWRHSPQNNKSARGRGRMPMSRRARRASAKALWKAIK